MSEQKAEYLGEVTEDVRHEIRDEAPHDFFTMIPHIVEALDLTPYAFRLYAHLKRVTGENKEDKCWKSTETLAEACRMSMGAVSNAKKELENTYPPLIRITHVKGDKGIYHQITITDLWRMNHDLSSGVSLHLVKTPRKPSCGEGLPSCGETKKSTIKKNPIQDILLEKKQKKGDLLDGVLFYQKQGLDQKIDEIENTLISLEKALRRNIPRTPEWQSLSKWIMKQDNFKEWSEWYMIDDFRANNSWRLTPQQIKNSWPQAPKKYVPPKPEPPKEKEVYLSGEELVRRLKGEK